MPEITLKNVYKTYKTGIRSKKTAVENISFDVNKGEIFGIIGANGAGKSTLIKMILGFIKQDSGDIIVLKKNPFDSKLRLFMGYLPENPGFYKNLSALELLEFGSFAAGLSKQKSQNQIKTLLNKMDIYSERKNKLKTFSKGMIQRIGICFSLVHDPDLIVLDEPMSGLDPIGRQKVIELVNEMKKRKKTMLFCSHILSDIKEVCDRAAIMHKAKLKRILTKEEIALNKMQDIFLQTIA